MDSSESGPKIQEEIEDLMRVNVDIHNANQELAEEAADLQEGINNQLTDELDEYDDNEQGSSA